MKKISKIILTLILVITLLQNCMNRDLQELNAKQDVIEKVNELFIFTDNRDWEKVKSVFADRVDFDMTSLAGGKPNLLANTEITSAWENGLKNLKAIHHQAGNYLVQINGDTADVFCYATATHYLPVKDGKNVKTFVGSYDIHLVKKEKWYIDRFKFNVKYVE
ncbi:MAG TPA: nuclear transport factor 2 family protein [Leptospiraceae bacterium]|nr:nuclear transport factor 2 family protein [Leptospiraceae bacterium]HMW07480.1 nuclear transport factor 2 family protein [Leptospiraceae bacterium]HMX33094.1 nuclear transport factor 2 family protein [Leptospiraceae bacterium]HMY33126.1 nuclear transport factor 2 family protein [Leptospiraceae bacterium]HMZ64251.1 nuclear transport factor 2 family protein [Leptospiraceae bacterium]